MSILLRQLARRVVQRVAADPRMREKLVDLGRGAAHEAGRISAEDDLAYAAGRAVRRVMNKLQNGS
jgi:hypothetical protein